MNNKYYTLQQDIITLCRHFAEQSLKSSIDEYARRKQVNENKIKSDIMLGKLAEFGVYFMYLEQGRTNITAPDLNIYSAKNKSFDPDLRWGMYNLHIKSQTLHSSERYGDSWVFQSKDPVVHSPNEYDIFIGTCITYEEGCSIATVSIMLEKKLDSVKFGQPKLQKFSANNKTCIYLKDNL
jgi:hypothetical protein